MYNVRLLEAARKAAANFMLAMKDDCCIWDQEQAASDA
jgi:hypothetical protein